MTPPAVFALNAHASYACQHSGACCRAGWTIPVEPRVRELVGSDWLIPDADGACPRFDRPSGLCRLHRDHGETALPESCFHFPRRARIDGRGTFVTLSHFCPTAAALLLDTEIPLDIVATPPAFAGDRGYEGLDAVDDWPPLLRPDVLFDHHSFGLWERYLVRTLGSSEEPVATALARIASTGERLRRWSLDRGPLLEWTSEVLAASATSGDLDDDAEYLYASLRGIGGFSAAVSTVPPELTAPAIPANFAKDDARFVGPAWNGNARRVLRYLGARAFASWTAYQSRGIRTQIAELFLAAAVLRVECVRACQNSGRTLDRESLLEAVRASDLLLVHLTDRDALMTALGKVETDAPDRNRR